MSDWQPTDFISFPGDIIGTAELEGHRLVFCQSDKWAFVYELIKRRHRIEKRFLFKRKRTDLLEVSQ